MQLKPFNSFSIAFMMSGALLLVFFCSFLEFPFLSTSIKPINDPTKFTPDPFTNLIGAFRKWDAQVGCSRFREKHKLQMLQNKSSSLQQIHGESECGEAKSEHVSVLTKSPVLVDKPDALLFETTTPPIQRHSGDPLRVYMDLEAGRKRSGVEYIFVSYHAKDDVQSTYAGALFHNEIKLESTTLLQDVKLQHRGFSLAACEAQPSSAMAGSATGSSCALCLGLVAMLSSRAQWQCNGCVMAVLDRQCNGCAQWLCSVAVLSKGSGGASSSAPPPWLPSLNEIDKTKVYQYTPKDLLRLLPRSCHQLQRPLSND
ncbi:hypothetical protein PS2_003178 [Malus domestica]